MSHGHYSRLYRYLGIGGAAITLIASFMLLLTHDQNKCSFTLNGSTRAKCDDDVRFICPNPAIDIQITSNTGLQYDIVCAWAKDTLTVSIASFVLSAIFVMLYSFKIRKLKGTKFVLGAGAIALVSLGVTFAMMLVDVTRGGGTVAEDYKEFEGKKDFIQEAFAINCLLVLGAFIAVLSLELHNYKVHYKRQKEDVLSPDHEIEEFYFG